MEGEPITKEQLEADGYVCTTCISSDPSNTIDQFGLLGYVGNEDDIIKNLKEGVYKDHPNFDIKVHLDERLRVFSVYIKKI